MEEINNIKIRYFIQLAYNGSAFHGWQRQPNANSVQETLETVFSTYFKEKIEITGAGRTDTGVHASFYVAHFDCANLNLEEEQNSHLYKLNSMLPPEIAIAKIKQMPTSANARFDATERTYKYFMHTSKNPFNSNFSVFIKPNIDIDLMNQAAEKLYMYTDFTSFSKLHTNVKTNNCKITFAQWTCDNNNITFTITANRFLRNMVRAIVGTLLQIGKHQISVSDFCDIIEQKNRCKAGTSVPAQGLFLTNIKYPYEI